MADVDEIRVCEKCLHPVDQTSLCPECQEPTVVISSLLLQTLRILRVKGWIVEKCYCSETTRIKFKLDFFLFAPPTTLSGLAPLLAPDALVKGVAPELTNMKPSVVVLADSREEAAKDLYLWSFKIPDFALPFGQDLCDECRQQGADWFFCRCRCPRNDWVYFSSGIPGNCIYADAQVVTKEVRLKQLEKFFRRNPIAKRKCGLFKP